MAVYPYQCPKCGAEYEVEQTMKEPPLETCQTEGCDEKPKRMIAARGGFVLNGGGWFKSGGY